MSNTTPDVTTLPGDSSSRGAVSAIAALYSAERSDQHTHLSVSLTLVAGAVVYLGVIANNFEQLKWSLFWAPVLPAPLWIVAAFHVILVVSIANRTRSILILEGHLVQIAELEECAHQIGIKNILSVRAPDKQPWYLKIQTIITYGGILGALIAVTAACWWHAMHWQGWTWLVIVTLPIYIILTILLALAWLNVVKMLLKATDGDVTRTKPTTTS